MQLLENALDGHGRRLPVFTIAGREQDHCHSFILTTLHGAVLGWRVAMRESAGRRRGSRALRPEIHKNLSL